MNRTIKVATVKRHHYESNGQLVRHLDDFIAAYDFARRLKTFNSLTLYEFICKRWTIEPKQPQSAPANTGTEQLGGEGSSHLPSTAPTYCYLETASRPISRRKNPSGHFIRPTAVYTCSDAFAKSRPSAVTVKTRPPSAKTTPSTSRVPP
jgi:hypothetical protein